MARDVGVDGAGSSHARARDRQCPAHAKKKALFGLTIALIAFLAAFELGRVSLRATPERVATATPVERPEPAVATPVQEQRDGFSISMIAAGFDAALPAQEFFQALPKPEPAATRPLPVATPAAVEPTPSAATLPSETSDKPPVEPEVEPKIADQVEVPELSPPATAPPVEPPAEAPPVVDTRRPYGIDEVDRPPASLSTQLPVYTRAALDNARQGSVRMEVLVGTDGEIDAVRLIDEIADSDLNRAAITAVLHWRFRPALLSGVPVRVWVPVTLDFSLSNDRMRSVVTISE